MELRPRTDFHLPSSSDFSSSVRVTQGKTCSFSVVFAARPLGFAFQVCSFQCGL